MNSHHELVGPAGKDGKDWEKVSAHLPAVYSGAEIPKYPVAVDPTLTNQRMLVQHSCFTLHGSDLRGLDEMAGELGLEKHLIKVVIDADEDGIDYLKQVMTWLGVTETTVFPDLEGLARELRLVYGLDRRRPFAT